MSTAYDNNLYQSPLLSPDPDPADNVFSARYNAAYSSQPNTPSSGQLQQYAPSPALNVQQGVQGSDANEQAFADSIAVFMAGEDVHNTLEHFVNSCLKHSRNLRAEALQNQNRAVRLMHLQAEAGALEAEAATWELLLHMYANTHKVYPAGTGGQQTAIKTVHHQVAETICNHPPLLQCARVVTWLEALFCKSQTYAAEQDQGPRFHDCSGVWSDTQAALQRQDHTNGLVSELDPDASTRQKASLQRDSSGVEDDLNAYLFELVKAGRISEAAAICIDCGQPWRAASLLGGGPTGPLPLGPAADAQGQTKAIEQLAAEVEASSSIALRSIWRWTCYQVAEAAAQHSNHQSEESGKHEAALYAALAGHLKQVLPVCQTRADILWAYTRSWLECQVDKHLADGNDKGNLVTGLRLGMDAVASTKRDEEVHRVVCDDVAGFWPPASLTEAQPDSFEAVLEAAQQAAANTPAGDMEHWQLHQDIIKQQFQPLLQRFVTESSTQVSPAVPSSTDKQQAVKLRLGAHLALVLGYLRGVSVPSPQAALHVRTDEDIQTDPDPNADQLDSSDDLCLQETANQLLEQYVTHLIKTGQHALVPLYACHMRHDVRRATYASYFHNLTRSSMEACESAYHLAQERFDQWHKGDIAPNELDIIGEQVMGESFWRIAEGPNLWAATLRWLCFSDSTLPLAAREANRLLRQLSLGGPAQLRAGLDFAFEALESSEFLSRALGSEEELMDLAAQRPQMARDLNELYVWWQVYQLERLQRECFQALAEVNPEDDAHLNMCYELGQDYINAAIQLCSSAMLNSIWADQDSSYQHTSPTHEVVLWVAPADDPGGPEIQNGDSYSLVPSDCMAEFVSAVQAAADSCCVSGITAKVRDGRPSHEVAVVTVTVSHAEVDVGTEVQCLNSFVKSSVPLASHPVLLQLIRLAGPDMCIGALAAMAAYPYLMLQAAELRQILLEIAAPIGSGSVLGHEIIPLVAGKDSDNAAGLTYYFTQQEIQQLLEVERSTELVLMSQTLQ